MKTWLKRLRNLVAGGLCCLPTITPRALSQDDPASAARAINALGLDLLRSSGDARANALLSPYSIQSALAMTFAGADGNTRAEMAKVLHYPTDEAQLHRSLGVMRASLEEIARRTAEQVKNASRFGGPSEPVTLTIANRLFGQRNYEFRAPFLALVKDTYAAPLQLMNFTRDASACVRDINAWVEEQTRKRIRDLIPPDGANRDTRLVLVNAIYLKAPWSSPFSKSATQPEPFHAPGGSSRNVATMLRQAHFGHARREGFIAVTVPYSDHDLQFLILLPDQNDGLAALEAKLTPELLAGCGTASAQDVILRLPKFRIEPPVYRLGKTLQSLGMNTAFDLPPGTANFDRMAPRKPGDYLYISEAFHKTFLALDEEGTEAAAATAVTMFAASAVMREPPKPIEVRVDHPFLFAVQQRSSGACLFLGRVTDPR